MTRLLLLKKTPIGNDSGFTLVEALIAMLVFTIGILATASLQTSSLNSNMQARQSTEAASIAASVTEDLLPLDYERDVELTEGGHAQPAQDQYNLTYTVQRDAIINNTMLIQVTINWTVAGAPKTVTLVTIKPDII